VNLRIEALSYPIVHELEAFEDSQCRARGTNGIVLVSDRVSKIRHDPITQELRDVAFVMTNHVTTHSLIALE
jgi:hypothetical protein